MKLQNPIHSLWWTPHTIMAVHELESTDSSGLIDAWIEIDLLGPVTAQKVLDGKEYANGMPTHKLSLQALCRLLTIYQNICKSMTRSFMKSHRVT